MEIKLPKSTNDLRLKHYRVLTNPRNKAITSLEDKIYFLSDMTGLHVNELKQIREFDITRAYLHCVEIFTGYKPKDPPKQITIKGKEYKRIDPYKVSSGWHIDFGNTDLTNDFERLACLFYYPVGSEYGEIDVNKNLVHPISERIEDFKEEFPMSVFMDASAFFLTKYKRSIDKSMVSLKIKKMLSRIPVLNRMSGSE